jgi:hypothetical protein
MSQQQDRTGTASEVGRGFGMMETNQDFYSVLELAKRWRCSRGTVYNRLRAAGARVLDFAAAGKRGRKVVATKVVLEIEARNTKRIC